MPRRTKKELTLTETLRKAVNECELSFAALERETGVLRQSLMKFASGETGLRLDAADRLAEFFGLVLTTNDRGD